MNGSGKTVFGTWLLSCAPFDRQPYVILDYKRDDLFAATDRIREIGLKEIPKHAGLYILRPRGKSENHLVEAWLWRAWERERIGIYADEGYMLPDIGALDAILTQGRSKRIPCTILTQRPVWVPRFVFSEARFLSLFHLNDERDFQTIAALMPRRKMMRDLPPYHSWWYDTGQRQLFVMQPAPAPAEIIDRLDSRLSPTRRIM